MIDEHIIRVLADKVGGRMSDVPLRKLIMFADLIEEHVLHKETVPTWLFRSPLVDEIVDEED
jgi:hypothetical protein